MRRTSVIRVVGYLPTAPGLVRVSLQRLAYVQSASGESHNLLNMPEESWELIFDGLDSNQGIKMSRTLAQCADRNRNPCKS